MRSYHEKLKKKDLGNGIIVQVLGFGENMNVLHWNMEDGSVVEWHNHPQEQFGYVIKGGFKMKVDDETFTLKAGDAYFIPSNAWHEFVTIGETEAIDVFSPIKEEFPGKDNFPGKDEWAEYAASLYD